MPMPPHANVSFPAHTPTRPERPPSGDSAMARQLPARSEGGESALSSLLHPSEATEWTVVPGVMVIMQGHGWPRADSRCPVHEVEPPVAHERMIMTLRHSTRGAGGGYDVGL